MAITVKRLHNFTGHRDSVYTLQQADTPHHFFSGSGDGMIVLWDLLQPGDGVLIAKLPNSIYALHYHTPSGMLIAGHNYEGINIIDWKEKKLNRSLQLTSESIFDIQSVGSRVFIGDKSGSLHEVDLENLRVVRSIKDSNKSLRTIAVNTQQGELAIGSSDHFIRVYDLDTMKLKYSWQAHSNSVFTIKYTPDSQYLLSGARDARLKLWDVKGGYMQVAEVVAHIHAINYIDFSPDSKHFVTCSMDRSIKLWDLDDFRLLKVIDKARHAGHGTSVNRVLWTNHQAQLLSASDDRTISVWNIFF